MPAMRTDHDKLRRSAAIHKGRGRRSGHGARRDVHLACESSTFGSGLRGPLRDDICELWIDDGTGAHPQVRRGSIPCGDHLQRHSTKVRLPRGEPHRLPGDLRAVVTHKNGHIHTSRGPTISTTVTVASAI